MGREGELTCRGSYTDGGWLDARGSPVTDALKVIENQQFLKRVKVQ